MTLTGLLLASTVVVLVLVLVLVLVELLPAPLAPPEPARMLVLIFMGIPSCCKKCACTLSFARHEVGRMAGSPGLRPGADLDGFGVDMDIETEDR